VTRENYTDGELHRIRELQRVAYECAERVAGNLQPGVTEKEAAVLLGDSLRDRGVSGFFHQPFAWFGDRAGLAGFPTPSLGRPLLNAFFAREFYPTYRRLEEGMCAILDVAPIRDGLCVDIGYTFSVGDNPVLDKALADLKDVRPLILGEIRAGHTMREVYRTVGAELSERGYECAHRRYPSQVLAHKIGRLPLAGASARLWAGFDYRAYLYFGRQMLAALPRMGRMPLWNEGPGSDSPPDPGLWAFEPHVRLGDVGAKWEELLVITDSDAYWLDDDLPHVRGRNEPRPAV